MLSSSRVAGVLALFLTMHANAENPWVVYEGGSGPGSGKKVVLISGDEEYRSEEGLPQLGKILAKRHGFTCTVLFAIDPESGIINPNYTKNIPGLEALDTADLMIIFTRFRELPDDQMEHIDKYLKSGKPVIGMRTSTHAFKFPARSKWERYSNDYAGEKKEWADGFGRLVLGEKWISHHGKHKYESTRGRVSPGAMASPIVRGIEDSSIWGPTDVYGVRLPLPGDCTPLILGCVEQHGEVFNADDSFYGMREGTGKAVQGEKNNPMMPVAWTKTYRVPGGVKGKSFMTTMGSSTDLMSEPLRKLIVNAAYWCLGMDGQIPAAGANAELVGEFKPTKFEFRETGYWQARKMMVGELGVK
jgi:hypothetical protein